MIKKTDSILSMLQNIIEKSEIIKKDFERNGEVACVYILEKLNSAQHDLKCLINSAQEELNRINKEYDEVEE